MTQFSDYKLVSLDSGLGLQSISSSDILELVDVEIATGYHTVEAILRVALADRVDSHLDYCGQDDIDIAAVRADMQEWLDAYMTLRVPVDYFAHNAESTSLDSALRKLVKRRDAFLAGDYTPLSARWQLYWSSESGCMLGGDYDSLAAAQRAGRELIFELLGQCSYDAQREGVLAGTIDIVPLVGIDGRDEELVGDHVETSVREIVDAVVTSVVADIAA